MKLYVFFTLRSFLTFQDNQCAISTHLCSQTMTDVVGNPEEERRAEFYYQPWAQEAVCRYFYSKVFPFSIPYHSFSSSCEVMQAAQFIYKSFASLKKKRTLWRVKNTMIHSQ